VGTESATPIFIFVHLFLGFVFLFALLLALAVLDAEDGEFLVAMVEVAAIVAGADAAGSALIATIEHMFQIGFRDALYDAAAIVGFGINIRHRPVLVTVDLVAGVGLVAARHGARHEARVRQFALRQRGFLER